MRPGNPAVYECRKGGERRIHYWKLNEDGTATCQNCKLVLNKDDADDCFRGESLFKPPHPPQESEKP
jgi:hypothetical protein